MAETAADDTYRFAPAAPEERIVHGACAPGWHAVASHDVAVDRWLSFMSEAGIRRVCCLLAGSGSDGCEQTLDPYAAAFGADSVRHVPLPDRRIAEPARLRSEVLPFLDRADAAGAPVVVHCLDGIGRTGQVLSAWLVHGRGYDPDEALATVREMGRTPARATATASTGATGAVAAPDVAIERELLDLLDRLG